MRGSVRSALLGLCLLAQLAGAGRALAQTEAHETAFGHHDPPAPSAAEAQARALFQHGVDASRTESWSEAERYFRQSAELVERPSTLFNWALTLVRLERGRDALRVIDRWSELTAESSSATERAEALVLRQRAEALLVRVTLELAPADARVEVNGVTIPGTGAIRTLLLEAGSRELVITAHGFHPSRQRLELTRGRHEQVEVSLVRDFTPAVAPEITEPPRATPVVEREARSPAPSAESPGRGPLPYVLFVAGGALLAAGTVTGLMALDAEQEFAADCPTFENCDHRLAQQGNRADKLALATDLLLGIGVLTVASGFLALELAPSKQPPVKAGLANGFSARATLRHSW